MVAQADAEVNVKVAIGTEAVHHRCGREKLGFCRSMWVAHLPVLRPVTHS